MLATDMERSPLVFPIRFATHATAVQTTTRELSKSGVFVRCLQPPPVGTPIAMKLYLPGLRDGVQATGAVHEHSPEGQEAGFWARFDALDGEASGQIGAALARRERAAEAKPIGVIALQPADDPRRTFPRVNARFAVRFATSQDFVLEYAANISAGGVFVNTQDPPALKSIVKVEMELPGGGPPVSVQAVVVHRVSPEEAKARNIEPGIGVQFMDADDQFRERIDKAIEHILHEGD